MNIFEINTENARADMDTSVKKNSPIVEVFSALVAGNKPNVSDAVLDKSVAEISSAAGRAMNGDPMAISELNTIIKYVVEPKLLQKIKLFDFMGTFKKIAYSDSPRIKTYKYESIRSEFQASSSDVHFGAYSWNEYAVPTQVISSGFAVDYRELQSGNFEGNVAEGMNQVEIDMQNKAVNYVIYKLYDGIKNATGVKHYSEAAGIGKAAVDAMLSAMRRYGQVTITGDYAVASQLNTIAGFRAAPSTEIRYASDKLTDEIVLNGLIGHYNGAAVVEIPNAYNFAKLNSAGTDYEVYMPEGLLFFVPHGAVSPLQIFQRGELTTMTASDIVTRQQLTRFDLEIAAEVAKGMEDQIGLVRDTNFTAPSL